MPNGDTATVTDTEISLGGHTLNALMLIGSTSAQGFGAPWTLQQKKGRWFISSMELGNRPPWRSAFVGHFRRPRHWPVDRR